LSDAKAEQENRSANRCANNSEERFGSKVWATFCQPKQCPSHKGGKGANNEKCKHDGKDPD
jgi:hypothetical protein